jgi:hypothetical protein
MRIMLEPFLGAIVAFLLLIVGLNYAPTSYWYEYEAIEPVKPVYVHGENLEMISKHRTYVEDTPIVFRDQLRCFFGENDKPIGVVQEFPTSLKTTYGELKVTPWNWGKVPKSVPSGSRCYIRSTQILTVSFGIKKTTTVYSKFFEVSDFDYTKQQAITE